jgi:hypothetical protein
MRRVPACAVFASMKLEAYLDRIAAPGTLLAGFLISTAIVIAVSLVLLYHWRMYAMPGPVITRMRYVYFVVAALLMLIQLGAILTA